MAGLFGAKQMAEGKMPLPLAGEAIRRGEPGLAGAAVKRKKAGVAGEAVKKAGASLLGVK